MQDNLQVCMFKCQNIINEINVKQRQKINKIFETHKIDKNTINQLKTAINNSDNIQILKLIRKIINDKPRIISILQDISEIYDKNIKNIDRIIECFLTHCNEESIILIKEFVELILDLLKLFNDHDINKVLDKINNKIKLNVLYMQKILSNPKSKAESKNDKSPRTQS